MARKLYVGNLPFSMSESELEALFTQVGPVDSVQMVRDRATGQPRGFAFVEMQSDEGAEKAIAELNRREVGGRAIAVNEARPKTGGPGGGGGYGGGGGGRGGGGGYGGGGGGGGRREPRW